MALNLRSPRTQKWIILLTLLGGVTYGYFNFLYLPRRELAKNLTVEIKKESEVLAKGKRIAANFQAVEEDYARLMSSWETAHELLPTQKEMEDLLKNITLCGQEKDMEFLLFKPLDPVEKPYYWENPIQVKTLSTFHGLGNFLSDVASFSRIVNIGNLKLSAYAPRHGRSPHTVEAEFVVTIFIFKDLGTSATVYQEATTGKAKGGKLKPNPSRANASPTPSSKKDKAGSAAKEKGHRI